MGQLIEQLTVCTLLLFCLAEKWAAQSPIVEPLPSRIVSRRWGGPVQEAERHQAPIGSSPEVSPNPGREGRKDDDTHVGARMNQRAPHTGQAPEGDGRDAAHGREYRLQARVRGPIPRGHWSGPRGPVRPFLPLGAGAPVRCSGSSPMPTRDSQS